ncbi:shikimate dehydrogenase [Pseudobutyrivibrio sp. 49]|uniref:shikimate dehydrogenase n=1 Tax=unclassified Pseudobutyrivibrio TaxID=2638619 RepID=UPI000890B4C1|nr:MULTISPECIES: shikimate dehydrogenase [unclassified Pseudobutyrivibrio]SDH30567.1 shikimate dehydrogenase [Pseudobutyrivibrio sp. 49]SFN49790.1 shikimate dehydrogenase [Pseudobutyrivibrio sp. UC1225]
MNPIGSTRLYCLLGNPVSHSISPAMHNLAFDTLGLDNSYMAFNVEPDDLPRVVDGLKAVNCGGFNCTMPFKTAIIPLLDEIDEIASLAHSVNTVVNIDGKLRGYTTDGIGFLQSMAECGIKYKGTTITMLGAGGVATSIITQAASEGVSKINIFKRKNSTFKDTVEYADKITKATECDVFVYDMADKDILEFSLQESDILINCTNVGMGDDDTSLVPKEFLHKNLIVCDTIYHPDMTRLLKDAAAVGCKTMNGKYMLLYQGAAAFKLWTGQEMPKDVENKIKRIEE